ncbi:type VI secretion system tip protein VgrG [Mucilaginibacter sp. AW1-3]
MAAPSPLNLSNPQLTVAITLAGNPLPDGNPIISINIVHELNRISYAEVVLVDGDIEAGTFPLSDGTTCTPGVVIEIKASYTSVAELIFSGYIVKQSVKITPHESSKIVLICKHKAVAMTYNRTDAEFSTKTDSDILTSIIGTYSGLSATVTSTSVSQETVFQKQATDWDFMLSRAEFYGYVVALGNDGSVTVGPPKTSATAVLYVAAGDSIRNFNATLNAEKQAPSLTASAWDIKNQALLTASGAEPSTTTPGNITGKTMSAQLGQAALTISSGTPMLQDELQAWADGSLMRMRMTAVKGNVSFIGSELVMPGNVIQLDKVGDRFNGNAFVASVNHVIEDGSWTTYVNFGLDNIPVAERSNITYPQASGQLPAIGGLQVATVKKISSDPDSQYRIQINLASNAASTDGIWARMANFYATSTAGSGFLPEIGDEVVVGFLESNPRYPVILGSLYSNAKQPAIPATDDNNYIKSLITKSNLKISFDDQNKVMTFLTPGNNSIVLSDKDKSIAITDQNSNSIKMSSSGIELTSNKDIKLTATGDITLNATGKVNLTATQDLVATGMNITATANMGFTGKGNATAEVSASGQTTIKGAIVMIN